ncbi:hypothetical protein HPB58_13180 [Priestia filamentosa]|uniref:hypothetical protein n=1 Tax=Priestia filamentosa TaxID=1402861 RepID=UPI001FB24C65|nr:hypothetical protein [Priestia filamentosa]UOE58303.1 hypothetical protein HPB58_13180 [Priestia filamentosa]
MSKQRMKVAVDEETRTYIQTYKEEHNIRYTGDAIARICKEHEISKNQEWSLKYISEVVSQNLHEVLKKELTKIRLGTNAADKNSQILIELLNGIFFNKSELGTGFIPTSVQEVEPIRIATEEVEKRIAHQRQKRIDWQESRGKQESSPRK